MQWLNDGTWLQLSQTSQAVEATSSGGLICPCGMPYLRVHSHFPAPAYVQDDIRCTISFWADPSWRRPALGGVDAV